MQQWRTGVQGRGGQIVAQKQPRVSEARAHPAGSEVYGRQQIFLILMHGTSGAACRGPQWGARARVRPRALDWPAAPAQLATAPAITGRLSASEGGLAGRNGAAERWRCACWLLAAGCPPKRPGCCASALLGPCILTRAELEGSKTEPNTSLR